MTSVFYGILQFHRHPWSTFFNHKRSIGVKQYEDDIPIQFATTLDDPSFTDWYVSRFVTLKIKRKL